MKNALTWIFLVVLLALSPVAYAQPEGNTVWYDARELTLKGKGWGDTENIYERLPARAKTEVSPQVWRLSKYTSGLYVLFTSNTRSIKLRWKNKFDTRQVLMSPLAVQGLDLYVRGPEGWRWAGVGRPAADKKNQAEVISGMSGKDKKFMLYLPMYDAIDSVFIPIESDAHIKSTPGTSVKKPVFFYGTSITQGAAASRPGMAYPAIIGRALNRETINLGFSGNGKMDMGIAKLLSEADAGMFVIDCLPNMAVDDILPRTRQLVRQIRSRNQFTPILLVENIRYTHAWLSKDLSDLQSEKNLRLNRAFTELKGEGVKELYYLDNKNLTKPGNEGATDGVHLTDQGFQHFAGILTEEIKKIEGANPPDAK